jgi:uncharacterized repeat protein (TIGR03806 family)
MPAQRLAALLFFFAASVTFISRQVAADEPNALYGIEKRIDWTTSRVTGTPDPPPPYQLRRVFPKLGFDEPTGITFFETRPGKEWAVIAERAGQIWCVPHDTSADRADLFLDLDPTDRGATGWGLPIIPYSVAFDPDFKTNRFVYVAYNTRVGVPKAVNRVSRFKLRQLDPPRADPDDEEVVIEWQTDGHNGCDIKFGPDRMLYISSGDGTSSVDELNTGQDASDLRSGILRIDPHKQANDRRYTVPIDNPFINLPNVRSELWAYGVRNPWKMSFDRKTGELWVGDNGQDLWEMAYRIDKGANYGWSVFEGGHAHRPNRRIGGPTKQWTKPTIVQPHTEMRSLTGGFVYRGSRLPQLEGTYLYGDYATGMIWGARLEAGQEKADAGNQKPEIRDQQSEESRQNKKGTPESNPTPVGGSPGLPGPKLSFHQRIADTRRSIIAFGEDKTGEVYILTFDGHIHVLDTLPHSPKPPAPFPRKLSETGIFSSHRAPVPGQRRTVHTPESGVIPYTVNSPLWSDGADKERFLALPPGTQMRIEGDGRLDFPNDSVLVKSFSLDDRWLETRLLHKERGEWRFYTYVWNDEQTDAELLGEEGLDRTFTVRDPAAPDGKREQKWRFPSRTECMMCHTRQSGFTLGLTTHQLNRDFEYSATTGAKPQAVVTDNQIRALAHVGLISNPPANIGKLPRHADPYDDAADLTARARSYLHVNCAHCHQRDGGGARADLQLLAGLDLKSTGMLNSKPEEGTLGLLDPRIIVPGNPSRSLLLHRLSIRGEGQMPKVGTQVPDKRAADMIRRWIEAMPDDAR